MATCPRCPLCLPQGVPIAAAVRVSRLGCLDLALSVFSTLLTPRLLMSSRAGVLLVPKSFPLRRAVKLGLRLCSLAVTTLDGFPCPEADFEEMPEGPDDDA